MVIHANGASPQAEAGLEELEQERAAIAKCRLLCRCLANGPKASLAIPTQAEARLEELEQERAAAEEARAGAEAAHEAELTNAAIRAEALGCDRADRHYWWFPGERLVHLLPYCPDKVGQPWH